MLTLLLIKIFDLVALKEAFAMPGTPSYRHACCCFYCVKTRTSPVRVVLEKKTQVVVCPLLQEGFSSTTRLLLFFSSRFALSARRL